MPVIDAAILQWMQENILAEWLTPLMKGITFFGEYGIGWISIALVLLFFKKTRKAGLAMGAALLMGLLLGEVFLKNVIARPRPFTALPDFQLLIPQPSGFSCPSGHTTSSFAASTALLMYHRKSGAAALGLAVLIGFSRLYFAVHYPSDVAFGILLGIGCGLAAAFLMRAVYRRFARNKA